MLTFVQQSDGLEVLSIFADFSVLSVVELTNLDLDVPYSLIVGDKTCSQTISFTAECSKCRKVCVELTNITKQSSIAPSQPRIPFRVFLHTVYIQMVNHVTPLRRFHRIICARSSCYTGNKHIVLCVSQGSKSRRVGSLPAQKHDSCWRLSVFGDAGYYLCCIPKSPKSKISD